MLVSIVREQEGLLTVRTPFNRTVISCIRKVPGRRWDQTNKAWLIPDRQAAANRLLEALFESGLFTAPDRPEDSAQRPQSSAALLERYQQALETRHYSERTKKSYTCWVRRFMDLHRGIAPENLGEREINSFLTKLAVKENVSASTQNQALAALLFLYREILGQETGKQDTVIRAREPQHLPVVLSRDEV